jgi:uncharacterized protein (TIGR02646 family)
MRKFQRVNQPEFLVDRWEGWGAAWERRLLNNPRAKFIWPEFKGKRINKLLLPPLKEQTQDHCSFCHSFPVSPPAIDTIEHFRPKSLFPREAFRWENLYFCCSHCQQKFEKFDEDLLRPDADDYNFDKYFRWHLTNGTLEVNKDVSMQHQRRAEVTIMLYRLNDGHPAWRKLAMRKREQGRNIPLDEFPYRHYVG